MGGAAWACVDRATSSVAAAGGKQSRKPIAIAFLTALPPPHRYRPRTGERLGAAPRRVGGSIFEDDPLGGEFVADAIRSGEVARGAGGEA